MIKLVYGLYSFVLVLITALLTKYFVSQGMIGFYDTLILPETTPQGYVFSAIWGILYFLLFLSFFIILNSERTLEQFKDANALFAIQLFLLILWTFSFFYMEQLWASGVVIILLDLIVALLMHTFFFINIWAFILLVPYLLWLLFATYTNVFIIFLN